MQQQEAHFVESNKLSTQSNFIYNHELNRTEVIQNRMKSLTSFSIIFHVLLACFSMNKAAYATVPKNEKIPAVLVFGDSIVDPGNNNHIVTVVKCNFPPYGRDFIGGKPTGRFSNGKVPSDLIAEAFGVKQLLPAYLDSNLQIEDLLTGVSFASGGNGYDPLTAKLVSVLSLSDQLDLFRDYLTKIKSAVGEERMRTIVSKSLYIVCTGSDDIANTYFGTPFRKQQYDINSYTDLMVSSASSFYQELHGLGARRIGVVGIPTLGCVPSQRTLRGGIQRDCSDSTNQAAMLFNSKLSSAIDSLNKKLPDFRLVYLDGYNPLLSIIQSPSHYGFDVTAKGCCGTGNVEVSILCNRIEACTDASTYLFWDSYHPSEKAYQTLLPMILNGTMNKFF